MRFDPRYLDMQPLHKSILVERVDVKSKSRLVIPDIAKEPSRFAKILRLGDKVIGLKCGQVVLVPGMAAKYPDWDTEDMMLITEDDVGGVYTGRLGD